MRFSPLTQRLGGDGANAWRIHSEALRARAEGKDVIVMSVGDSEFDTPSGIVDACISALHSGDTHYTEVAGRHRLRSAIANNHQQKTGVQTTAENVIVSAGCQNALFIAAQIALSPGDEVIVFEPMYVTYEAVFQAPGATIVPVPCPAELGFRPDLAALRAAITAKTTAVVFANPVNPTGVVFPPEDLAVIAEVARQNDLWVIADEVYADLLFEGEHVSIASLEGMKERAITVSSLSKSHAMTGWRSGWAIAPEPFVQEMEKLALCSTYGLPGFIQEAAAFALENRIDKLDEMRSAFMDRRDLAMKALQNAPGLECWHAQAGMFLIVDVRKTGLSGEQFVERLYAETGVSVLNGAAFGPSTNGTVRMSFAVPEETLQEGCARIQAFTKRLQKETGGQK
ncbi:MAG: aminotransferase class I/II-fold pyridoxal phosphate-dependent enzyme [Alphaproteobacteria bacterium]|nr:aminotransferase class I/II-fold pyridoxal phosphate-dependent enzyme [Alphaproteobacteria bacterium]